MAIDQHSTDYIETSRRFFDELAGDYRDVHSGRVNSLEHRVALLRSLLAQVPARDKGGPLDRVAEIGCGPANHLRALASHFQHGVGIDFAPRMVDRAKWECAGLSHIAILQDDAQRLDTLEPGSCDAVISVGTLEHIPGKPAVFRAVRRSLVSGGTFISLTTNGNYLWNRLRAGAGFPYRHLDSDRFVRVEDVKRLAERTGFSSLSVGAWSFVPTGDLPPGITALLYGLDRIGLATGIAPLRGGLWFSAVK